MNRKLSPSAVSLALSISDVSGGNIISAAEDIAPDVLSAETIIRQGKADAIPLFLNNLDIGGSNKGVDVGILSENNDGRHHRGNMPSFQRQSGGFGVATRFLQEELPTCAYPETCEPNLCACTAKGGLAYECAVEINAVCNKVTDVNGTIWTLGGCVGDMKYYRKVICPFAKCIVEGGTYGTCYCQQYQTVCDIYGDRQKYEVSSFFGSFTRGS